MSYSVYGELLSPQNTKLVDIWISLMWSLSDIAEQMFLTPQWLMFEHSFFSVCALVTSVYAAQLIIMLGEYSPTQDLIC